MPVNRIKSSNRARSAIAAVVALAGVATGGVRYVLWGDARVPDDVALAATYLVEPWEGVELKAYLDRIARPPVWTICGGDTANVKPGMVETKEGCRARLERRMTAEFRPALVRCIAGFEKAPLSWRGAMDSLAWNIGPVAACRSTAARLGRAGQYHSSCLAATAFNRAGGRRVKGLVSRREMGDATRIGEAELCVSGLR
jgi:GH24 family phage-related lysozyme (muramidase)